MNKLTAEVARRDIGHLKSFQSDPKVGLSLKEEKYLQALEIALPVLEQQERGGLVRVAFTGSGSLEAIKHGGEGFIWGSRADAHPIELFVHCKDAACEKCNGTGQMDSGGTQPWGEQILVECDCQLEQQPPTDTYRHIENDGWIELGEGAIPVHPETLVEIKMRNGATDGPRKATGFLWYRGNAVRDEMDCDIIAYRVIDNEN